jgi:hypothetical protein
MCLIYHSFTLISLRDSPPGFVLLFLLVPPLVMEISSASLIGVFVAVYLIGITVDIAANPAELFVGAFYPLEPMGHILEIMKN